jgi:hypothetical protein
MTLRLHWKRVTIGKRHDLKRVSLYPLHIIDHPIRNGEDGMRQPEPRLLRVIIDVVGDFSPSSVEGLECQVQGFGFENGTLEQVSSFHGTPPARRSQEGCRAQHDRPTALQV